MKAHHHAARLSFLALGMFSAALCLDARAADLTIATIEITQGYQVAANSTALVAFNPTAIRVKVALNGATAPQAGVDAIVRVYSGGVEIAGSPLYSTNGPISAPVVPNSVNLNDTLNFYFIPPQSTNVDFVVTLNPFRTIAETSYANNNGSVLDRSFLCRKIVELAYVPINYTIGGGLPSAAMMQPGGGDNFLRGIYRVRDWNYHRSPLGNLTWSSDVNNSATTLLNSLNDIRQNQVPAAGYTRPEFIYGWLLGNPYSGNGVAIGVPGAAAFGNTLQSKYQRTFAHEVGHLWGQQHNSTTIGAIAFDVENHLRDPLAIGQPMAATKKDIMYAGLTTIEAWVNQTSYLAAINDARSACTGANGEEGGGDGASDSGQAAIRFAGSHDHQNRRIALQPAFDLVSGVVDGDDATGNVWVEAYDRDGALVHAIRRDTARCRERCEEDCAQHRETSFYAVLPRFINGREIESVTLREVRSGHILCELKRSAHAPTVGQMRVAPALLAIGKPFDPARAVLRGPARMQWDAHDGDGDSLVANLLYSPNAGDAWTPIAIENASGVIEFDADLLPQSRAQEGRFRLRVSDGFNTTDSEFAQGFTVGGGTPPDVHLLSPNTGASVMQGSTVIFHASAWDLDDQYFNDGGVSWTSSIDGSIGTGRVLSKRDLSAGTHTMTLRGTDGSGMSSEVIFSIIVVEREFNSGDLDGDGLVNAADLAIVLSGWNASGLADLNVDGVVGADDLAILLSRWDM